MEFKANTRLWGLEESDVKGWARWAALKHVKVMMDAQNRTEDYNAWIEGSTILTQTDIGLEQLKKKL